MLTRVSGDSTRYPTERMRPRRQPSSSSRSYSTADERPLYSPVLTHSDSRTTATRSTGSSEEGDSDEYGEPRERRPSQFKHSRGRLYIDTKPGNQREASRTSRHRVPAPEAPPLSRQYSRSSRGDYRDIADERERMSYRQERRPLPYRTRAPSAHSDDMHAYDERRRDYFAPRHGQAPMSAHGSYEPGYNPSMPPPPPVSQVIPFQQPYQQPYYNQNPLMAPYMQPNPLSPSISNGSSYNEQMRAPHQAGPQYFYVPYPVQSPHGSVPPSSAYGPPTPKSDVDEDKFDEKIQRLEDIIMANEKSRQMREQQRDMKEHADRQMAAQSAQKELNERKAKEQLDAAIKLGKAQAEAEAEKKAKDTKAANEKALAEAKAAADDAKAEAEKYKPSDDAGKAPIRFKDAVGRKFVFPWRVCKTWRGMEELINQAFLQVDVVGKQVRNGHYDLLGPDGEIILPQVWESTVQPDWHISMQLWPVDERKEHHHGRKEMPPPPPSLQHKKSSGSRRELIEVDRFGRRKSVRKRDKSASRGGAGVSVVPPAPSTSRRSSSRHAHAPPTAPAPPTAMYDEYMPPPPPVPAPPPIDSEYAPSFAAVKERRKSKQQEPNGLAVWMAKSMGMPVKRK